MQARPSALSLALAFGAVIAAGLPAPGQFLALGLGVAAIGTGWLVFSRRSAPGATRLFGAAAITVGCIGMLLGIVRVAITLAAIGHLERMVS
jgi:hypothetical protein